MSKIIGIKEVQGPEVAPTMTGVEAADESVRFHLRAEITEGEVATLTLVIARLAQSSSAAEIEFEDCLKAADIPDGLVNLREILTSKDYDFGFDAVLEDSVSALCAANAELAIEKGSAGNSEEEFIVFELKIGMFLTHARCPADDIKRFLVAT